MKDRLEQRLDDHIDDSEKYNIRMDNRMDRFENNHLFHMQEAVNEMKVDISNTQTDVAWLKRFFWIIATASVGGLITSILNLIVN